MKVSILRYAAIGMASLALTGFAAASTVSIGTTGSDSHNRVNLNNSNTESLTNRNGIGVGNVSAQRAGTGNVDATRNTSVSGDLKSGPAMNDATADTMVTVGNSSLGSGASMSVPDDNVKLSETGPDSTNTVSINNTNHMTTTNTNDIRVVNLSLQSAQSGDVSASRNTKVGGLSSGEASNSSHQTTKIDVSN